MIYFSYNDFIDCTENGKIEEITKVAENISKYEQKNGLFTVQDKEKHICEILKDKIQLKKFLKDFFNLQEVENINYYNIKKRNKEENIIVSKIIEKEIYILIKVIENIDNNISYKMFEESLEIINKWNIEEKVENKRYPIVIPIVIYVGKQRWKKDNNKSYNKINYTTYEDNKISFSYNIIKIQDLKVRELEKMESNIAKEIIDIKNKYLQIN